MRTVPLSSRAYFECFNGKRTGRQEHPAVRGVDVENPDAVPSFALKALILFCLPETNSVIITPDCDIKEPSTARDELPKLSQNFLIVGSSALLAP